MLIDRYATLLGIADGPEIDGRPSCQMDPAPCTSARKGVMHGGAVGSIVQYAALIAVVAADRAKSAGKPIVDLSVVSMAVDYLQPGFMIRSYALGRVVKLGGRVAHVNVEAWTEDRTKPFANAKLTIGITR